MQEVRSLNGRIRSLVCASVIICALFFLAPLAALGQNTYVYVANYYGNSVSGYSVNPATGALTEVPSSPFAAGTNPIYLSLDRQCRYIYAPNNGSSNISSYAVDQNTGILTELPGSPNSIGQYPNYSATDQSSKFLYVANQGQNTISGFTINGDSGSLNPIAGSPFPSGGSTTGQVIVHPSSKFLFAVNASSNDVSGFTIDQKTGALSAIAGSPWPTGGNSPRVLKTDNSGQFLYVSNRSSISIFAIDQNSGVLTQVGSPFSFGAGDLYTIAIDPSNKFLYAGSNFQGVYGFSIDNNTGRLTSLPGFPIQTDSPQGNPVFAIEPTLGLMYTASFGGSDTVSVWKIDPNSGALTQIPGFAVPTGSSPAVVATCTADADGALARLDGGNTLNGNQTVNGSLTATSFAGNGSFLSNVTAVALNCTACVGNGQINFNYAVGDQQGGNAVNALRLGGFLPNAFQPAGSYATTAANSFTGNQTMPGLSVSGSASAGSVTIGGGTAITEYVSVTAQITVPAINAASCTGIQATVVSGFTPGTSDTISLSLPAALVSVPSLSTTAQIFLMYQAWESSQTTSPLIMIQVCNPTAARYKGGNTGTVRIDIFKH